MYTNNYRYAITWCTQTGEVLASEPIRPDLAPLAYWAEFQALRFECIAPGAVVATTIEPVWHGQAGAQRVDALKLRVEAGAQPVNLDVPVSWFDPVARAGSSVLVEQGLLEAGETFKYIVSASPLSVAPRVPGSSVRAIEPVLDVVERPLAGRLESCTVEEGRDELDVPVILPGSVIEQTGELARAAGAYETGGILIGDICRDGETRELYIDVTAQIPAQYTRSELTQLTFTPETWTDVQDVITRRDRREIMCGWWHSQSYMKETCKDCSKGKDGSCNVNAAFMSGDDVALHRTTFPRAYSLALVVGDGPCSGLTRALFGWRRGVVAARGYHIECDQTPVLAAAGRHGTGD